ncbi:DUF5658 family protein [Sulfolobus spindle-shaped virus 4]|uniref:DUF5658 domain-containing protein n=2 Tax=Alphafusellovirus TaxID=10475 RepID=A8TKK0_9VIRU|nr:DUF5658 family protein [Sulfolobus spindle-shaped virus 4]YP_002221494.1 DUF5658 family protein [Sulfolobus spindle-shaped virus 5]ABV26216.1 hypothetical protein [Sulfolobus spindle-shaped virus 4]ABV26250.1 hypothetical protein [Sulfolobus spindle-shaped virus 5]
MTILYDILLYYGFQFNDYWTTILGVNVGAHEANIIAKLFMKNKWTLAIYKFDLATVALMLGLMLPTQHQTEIFLLVADVVECLVTLNNIFAIRRHKRGKK